MKPFGILQRTTPGLAMLALFFAATIMTSAAQKSIVVLSPEAGSSFPTAPVRITVRLDSVIDANRFRVYLNRRDVTGKFARTTRTACSLTPCDLTAEVYPANGLVRGSNELTLELTGSTSDKAKVRRVFTVTGPKANAGPTTASFRQLVCV